MEEQTAKKKQETAGEVLTDSWKLSFFSIISLMVSRIFIHSFSSCSISFLVCFINLAKRDQGNVVLFIIVLIVFIL